MYTTNNEKGVRELAVGIYTSEQKEVRSGYYVLRRTGQREFASGERTGLQTERRRRREYGAGGRTG